MTNQTETNPSEEVKEPSQEQNVQETEAKKPFNKKPLFIALAVVLVLAVGGVFGYQYLLSQSPMAMLAKASVQMEQAKTLVMEGDMHFQFDIEGMSEEEKTQMDMVSQMGLGMTIAQDTEGLRYYMGMSLDYQGTPMLGAEMYMDKEKLGVSVPFLLDKWAYSDYETLSGTVKDATGMQITVKDYIKYLDGKYYKENFKNMNEKEMVQFMMEKFKDKLKKEEKKELQIREETLMLQPISLEMDFEDLMSFMDEYMKKFGENGSNMSVDLIKDVVKTAKSNGDFDTWGITDADLETMYQEMEVSYDPNVFQGEAFAELKENMNITYHYVFYLDGKQNMRRFEMVANVDVTEEEQQAKITVDAGFDIFANEPLLESYFQEADSYHLIQDLQTIQQQVINNAFGNAMTLYEENEGFRKLMDSFGGLPF